MPPLLFLPTISPIHLLGLIVMEIKFGYRRVMTLIILLTLHYIFLEIAPLENYFQTIH